LSDLKFSLNKIYSTEYKHIKINNDLSETAFFGVISNKDLWALIKSFNIAFGSSHTSLRDAVVSWNENV
jgi:hypothetical protein